MKFMHLADIHLGKTVNNFSMAEEQKAVLNRIIDIIAEENIDALVIAGDIYDKNVPSLEAVNILDNFLTALSDVGIPVYIISGNHDSADRLGFGSSIISRGGIYISQSFRGVPEKYTLEDEYGLIDIYLLPFIKPAMVRHFYGDDERYSDADFSDYDKAMAVVMENTIVDKSRRNILVSHQFVIGAQKSGSEDVLSVGGIDQINVVRFDKFDYVALGHIHGNQKVGRECVRYAGSPLKYSFSELNQKKCAQIVEMRGKGDITLSTVPLTPVHDMAEIRGKYEELISKIFYENSKNFSRDDYLRIILTDEMDIPLALQKLKSIYPNVMEMYYDRKKKKIETDQTDDLMEEMTAMEIIAKFYQTEKDKEMNQDQREYLTGILEDIR